MTYTTCVNIVPKIIMKGTCVLLLVTLVAGAPTENLCPKEQATNWQIEMLLPHENCQWFYKCTHGRPVAFICAANLYFNIETSECDWPANVDCGDRISAHSTPRPITPVAPTRPPTTTVTTPLYTTFETTSTELLTESDLPADLTEYPTDPPTDPPMPTPTQPLTESPTEIPTPRPTDPPTPRPTDPPTPRPTDPPTPQPTDPPTPRPTDPPTLQPTDPPTSRPTDPPTPQPTDPPTPQPTDPPTPRPTDSPTTQPTEPPTMRPTDPPTARPTESPTQRPTEPPTTLPPTERPEIELQPNGCPVDPDIHWLLPHETNCNLFYYCVWGEPVLRRCPRRLHFNPVRQMCEWPWSAGCKVPMSKFIRKKSSISNDVNVFVSL